MIPYILAVVGGYLIGDSMKDSQKFADGGKTIAIQEVKPPNYIITSVPSTSIPMSNLPKAEVGLGLSMGGEFGRITLTNKDYKLEHHDGKVALKLTNSGKLSVRRNEPKYLNKIQKFADNYLLEYAKKIKMDGGMMARGGTTGKTKEELLREWIESIKDNTITTQVGQPIYKMRDAWNNSSVPERKEMVRKLGRSFDVDYNLKYNEIPVGLQVFLEKQYLKKYMSMAGEKKMADGGETAHQFFNEKYLIGKRIKMIYMDDPYPIEPNTMGTIKYVDGMGQYRVQWDNGRTLSVIPNEDKFEIFK
jgi:hypothetical protein